MLSFIRVGDWPIVVIGLSETSYCAEARTQSSAAFLHSYLIIGLPNFSRRLLLLLLLWLYSPICWTLTAFSASWSYTQSVGLLGRGISPLQGCCLHTEQHKHRINAHTDIYAPSGIRTHDPSIRATTVIGWLVDCIIKIQVVVCLFVCFASFFLTTNICLNRINGLDFLKEIHYVFGTVRIEFLNVR
jgi:hypothetical protein